jgi:hypothetical protein
MDESRIPVCSSLRTFQALPSSKPPIGNSSISRQRDTLARRMTGEPLPGRRRQQHARKGSLNRQRSSERLLAEREVRGVYPARRTSTDTRRKDSLLRYKRLRRLHDARLGARRRPGLRRAGGRLKIGSFSPPCGRSDRAAVKIQIHLLPTTNLFQQWAQQRFRQLTPFRTGGIVTIWLYIIGEREVDGVCRAVFALHEEMHHGAGLAPEEVADFAQRERRGFVYRRDHVAFR